MQIQCCGEPATQIQSLSLREPDRRMGGWHRGGQGGEKEKDRERGREGGEGGGGGGSDRPLESQPLSPGARSNQPL